MAREKGSGGVLVHATVPLNVKAACDEAALLAGQESRSPVAGSEMARRVVVAGASAVLRCAGCRSGKCPRHKLPCPESMPAPTAPLVVDKLSEIIGYSSATFIDESATRETKLASSELAKLESSVFQLAIVGPKTPATKKAARAKSAKRTYPEGFALTEEMRAYAERQGVAADRVDGMFETFRLHHCSKGTQFVDWTLAFYTWARNDKDYGPRNRPSGTPKASADQTESELPPEWR